jgi:polysaccharide export outer membrane protein
MGCQAFDFYDQSVLEPVATAMEPPRELAMRHLPAYRIEPPDVLNVEVLKLVPLPPYRAKTFDVLQIQVVGTLLDQPINDFYLVDADGTVNLGPAYGKTRVAGMTVEEAKEAITQHLRQVLRQPEVSVQLAQASGTQPVTGQYLVAPDGTINLRQYGQMHVAGKTIAEAEVALDKHLAQFFDSPDAAIEVVAFNSKVYYIVTQGAGLGDNVVRVPVTGNETVLDALTNVGGLSQLSSKKIWIARPAYGGFGCEQILPVDYDAVTQGASTCTNYQILPDDRLFIAEDRWIAANTFVAKVTDPIQRLLGFTTLGISTVRSTQILGGRFRHESVQF